MRIRRREKLASKRQMGCPQQLAYPLDAKKRIINAGRRYRQKGTVKCGKTFWRNWCRRAKSVGWTKDLFKLKCTPRGKPRRR